LAESSAATRLAPIIAVRESLVTIDVRGVDVMRNEVGHILLGKERLKCEVLRVREGSADLQVFEDTRGVRVGDQVEMSGEMLSVALGPGLLGTVYDGLQNPLEELAKTHGFFLPRGIHVEPISRERRWAFIPKVSIGDRVVPGQVLGTVQEGHIAHGIMVPLRETAAAKVTWIREGSFTIDETVARIEREDGTEVAVTMVQRWPVRRPVPEPLLRRRFVERLYPSVPLTTTQRIIDTFFPIARGGTGCVPGPFGAGKTVLQSLIAKFSTVDVVIIIACGERAGEVVETITEYPEIEDPRTGRPLMERTIIICNTSSMPVAARESSIYTGITLGEYYRQMGYDVLCLADSTSRWAQAMRELSGAMEEIPGEEAFPAYLDSSVKAIYERAGVLSLPGGKTGSLTLIGTVSPAGGNFEEPVTQSTLGTVKTFLGLSADRAYRRFFPAIDPLISWSRYLDQLAPWFTENQGKTWVADVRRATQMLADSESIHQMMQVTGEEGVSIDDFVAWQKGVFLDLVFLQQDAFDDVDASTSRERQASTFRLLLRLLDAPRTFHDKEEVRTFYTRLAGLVKNLNYSREGSPEYADYWAQAEALAAG
jgi:V/A-type H+-transporting ATPase subunit A